VKQRTAGQIVRAMRDKNYVVFSDDLKRYNLNLFGIRAVDNDDNRFNDVVGVMYPTKDGWVCFQFPATTDPGLYWREHPLNVDGTAILKPGQYRGAYKVGKHKGYTALQQKKPLTVYRDADGDAELDFDVPTQDGMFGINIHRANNHRASTVVDKWSAGCQVVADPLHFQFLLSLCLEAKELWGNSFTYTLLTEDDFNP
jgi:hypothetical protein